MPKDCQACLKGAPVHRPSATTLAKRSILQDETVDQDGRYTLEGRVLAGFPSRRQGRGHPPRQKTSLRRQEELG